MATYTVTSLSGDEYEVEGESTMVDEDGHLFVSQGVGHDGKKICAGAFAAGQWVGVVRS